MADDGSSSFAVSSSASSAANLRDPAYPHASAAKAAKTTGLAGLARTTSEFAARLVASAYASAAASITTRPLIAAFAPNVASWNSPDASNREDTRTKPRRDAEDRFRSRSSSPGPDDPDDPEPDAATPSTPSSLLMSTSPWPTAATTEYPPTGRQFPRLRHSMDVSAALIRASTVKTRSGFANRLARFSSAKVRARSVPSRSRSAIGKSSNRAETAPMACGFQT